MICFMLEFDDMNVSHSSVSVSSFVMVKVLVTLEAVWKSSYDV